MNKTLYRACLALCGLLAGTAHAAVFSVGSTAGVAGTTTAGVPVAITADGSTGLVQANLNYDNTKITLAPANVTNSAGFTCSVNQALGRVSILGGNDTGPIAANSTICTIAFPINAGATFPIALTLSNQLCSTFDGNPTGQPCTATNGTITGPVITNPTITYAPSAGTVGTPGTVNFPAGIAGATTATITVTPSGSTNGGSTTVNACAIAGGTPASFTAPVTTPANGVFTTTNGSIDLGCTRGVAAASTTLTCQETPNGGAATARVWNLNCPAALQNTYTATAALAFGSSGVGTPTANQNIAVVAAPGNPGSLSITGCSFVNGAEYAFNPAPSFPLNVAAGATVNLPVRYTPIAQGASTGSVTCTTTNASAASFTTNFSGTGVVTNPTLAYNPVAGTSVTPGTVNFPGGIAGAATTTISVTPSGSVGGGSTTVFGCGLAGGTPASFTAPTTTPANGVFTTNTGTINLGCTRGASAVSTTLTCNEGVGMRGFPMRVWTLNCPAATVNTYTSTASLPFGSSPVGTPTASQNIAVAAAAGNAGLVSIDSCSFVNGAEYSFNPAPTFPLTIAAGASVNLPVRYTPTTAGASTGSVTCLTSNAGAVSFTTNFTGNGVVTNPSLAYNPAAGTVGTPGTLTFPTGPAGAATSTISVTPTGAVGGGSTSVTACAVAGGTPASFAAPTTTPANGIFTTTAGTINLGCTRGGAAVSTTLTCQETPNGGAATARVWTLNCPAAATNSYTSTAALVFGPSPVGTPTANQNVAVAAAAGNLSAISITGCSFVNGAEYAFNPAPTFPLTVAAGATVNLPVRYNPTTAGASTGSVTCTTTNSAAASFTTNFTGNGVVTGPTLAYNPVAGTVGTPGTLNFPAGPAGATTSTISVTPTGAAGGGSTSVTSCGLSGGTPASFSAPTTTPANGVYTNTAGTINLGCTRGGAAVSTTLTCTETPIGIAPIARVWTLNCPAGLVNTYTATPALTFASTAVGTSTAAQNIAVVAAAGNTGAVSITGCTFGGSNPLDFGFSPAQSFPISVAAGATVNLPVRFTPTAIGGRSGSVLCTTANSAAANFTTTFTGSAFLPTPVFSSTPVSGTTITLPAATAGSSSSAVVLVTNLGTGLGSVSCTVAGTGFAVAPLGLQTVGVGASQNFTVSASSNVGATLSGTLTCVPSAGQSFVFPLSASFVAPLVTQVPVMGSVGRFVLLGLFAGLGALVVLRRRS